MESCAVLCSGELNNKVAINVLQQLVYNFFVATAHARVATMLSF